MKDSLQFSQDLLRYSVSADGSVGDGSAAAQVAFLAGYQKLDWRYGGSTWPGAATTAVGKINMGPAPQQAPGQ